MGALNPRFRGSTLKLYISDRKKFSIRNYLLGITKIKVYLKSNLIESLQNRRKMFANLVKNEYLPHQVVVYTLHIF